MLDPGTRAQALAELRTADPEIRERGLEVLSEDEAAEVTEALLEVLPQIDTTVRLEGYNVARLIVELAARGERRAISPIIEILKRDLENGDDHQIRETSCAAFVDLHATEALPFLSEALFLESWDDLEDEVAQALAAVGGAAVEDTLVEALAAKNVRASKKERLKAAALGGLRLAGTAKAIGAVGRAAKSKKAELRLSALLTLAIIDANRADEHVAAALANATDYLTRDTIVRVIGRFAKPDLSPHLVGLIDLPEWKSERFDILEIIGERAPALAIELLERVRAATLESPWLRVRARAQLLRLRYDDALVEELLESLATLAYVDDRDESYNVVNAAGNAALNALVQATASHPAQFLETVLLLDDVRQGRVESYSSAKWRAGELVEQIVGSAFFRDFDQWVADFRAKHGLAESAAEPPPSDAPLRGAKKPWWKIWS